MGISSFFKEVQCFCWSCPHLVLSQAVVSSPISLFPGVVGHPETWLIKQFFFFFFGGPWWMDWTGDPKKAMGTDGVSNYHQMTHQLEDMKLESGNYHHCSGLSSSPAVVFYSPRTCDGQQWSAQRSGCTKMTGRSQWLGSWAFTPFGWGAEGPQWTRGIQLVPSGND